MFNTLIDAPKFSPQWAVTMPPGVQTPAFVIHEQGGGAEPAGLRPSVWWSRSADAACENPSCWMGGEAMPE